MERLLSKVEYSDECWLWVAALSADGYGRFRFRGRNALAHRVSLELHSGAPLPAGLEVDHLCRNRRCIRPDHLDLVDHATNVRRKPEDARRRCGPARWTECKVGHPLTDDNVLVNARGARMCRECNRRRSLERKARLKMEAVS